MAAVESQSYPLFDAASLARWLASGSSPGLSPSEIDAAMAEAACRVVTYLAPRARRVGILAGGGGNGRQARALAEHYRPLGMQVLLMTPTKPPGIEDLRSCTVLVDGLIGTGLQGPLSGPYRDLVGAAQASGRPIVALDGPTGLDLDRGGAQEGALRASCTIFCGAPKIGAFTGSGPEFCGETMIAEGGVSTREVVPRGVVPGLSVLAALKPARPRHLHKDQAGALAIVGGDIGMPGAVRLAASAAFRVGAGLVMAAVHESHAGALAAACPELMAYPRPLNEALLARARCLVVGSGLGRRDFGRDAWSSVRAMPRPLVVDGDALYWLAQEPEYRTNWILTPHEGEAARLLGVSRPDIARDRPGAADALQGRYGGVCVLKGAGTLIASGDPLWLCPWGNPGMATAGMGDVLAGVIAGLVAQGLSLVDAARLGVFVHAGAGDRAAAQIGSVGLLASDVVACLPSALSALC